MTYEEFIDKLRTTPREWELGPDGQLRILRIFGPMRLCACPITASYAAPSGLYSAGDVNRCAKQMGLDEDLWRLIARAADALPEHDAQIRRDLLKACGIAVQ